MKSSLPKYWWAEIVATFVVLSTGGAIALVAMYGREWGGGSILPLLRLPFQVIFSSIIFGYLFAARRYSERLLVAVPAVNSGASLHKR